MNSKELNCNNVRKYFYAFLDGELNVEKNIKILAHLNMCCMLQMQSENRKGKITSGKGKRNGFEGKSPCLS